MEYSDINGTKVSRLGFGTMRFPSKTDGSIDIQAVEKMFDYAIEHGVNYFDTAVPYHDGLSEVITGKILNKYPREKWLLADKFPGHQVALSYYPEQVFEEQLKKCGVEYFDFYLLHNVYENSIQVYKDDRWKIIDYFIEQKNKGRIKQLGFSTHAEPKCMEEFLDYCNGSMDFCQIELNYLDWTLQHGKEKYDILAKRGIPIITMESTRGGKLCNLSEQNTEKLKQLRPDENAAAFAFRYLASLPEVSVILSGMSNMQQVEENVKTFSSGKALSEHEINTLYEIAETMKKSLPCTACRYCCKTCPMHLDIPGLLSTYNDLRFDKRFTVIMRLDALSENELPSACISCGACTKICPQKIDVPAAMKDFTSILATMPKWADICLERDKAAK